MNIGKTIREIRLMKNLKLKNVADTHISTSFLGRVEREKNRISATDLLRILEKLNVTFDEFHFIHNGFKLSKKVEIIEMIMENLHHKNENSLTKLEKQCIELYQTTFDIQYLHLSILTYCAIKNFDTKQIENEKIEPIVSYLFKIEGWTRYELNLFSNFMFTLETETVLFLSEKVINDVNQFWKIQHNDSSPIFPLLINLIIFCFNHDRDHEAEKFLKVFGEQVLGKPCTNERVHLKFLTGIKLIRSNNIDQGLTLCKKMIDILSDLDLNVVAIELENYLGDTLSRISVNQK